MWGSGVPSRWQHLPIWLQPRALWTVSSEFFPLAFMRQLTRLKQSLWIRGSPPLTLLLTPHTADYAKRQQAWDEPCCRKVAMDGAG